MSTCRGHGMTVLLPSQQVVIGRDIDGGQTGECSALLTPSLSPTGRPMYDTAKYPDIAESSTFIIMACGNYDEVSITTGLMSGGSMDGGTLMPLPPLSPVLSPPRSCLTTEPPPPKQSALVSASAYSSTTRAPASPTPSERTSPQAAPSTTAPSP